MKKTRLMIITHNLAIGGLQQIVVNLAQNICKDKFSISILCLRDLGEYVSEIDRLGIKVHFVWKGKRTNYFLFFRIANLLRKEKIHIIHTHNSQSLVDGTLGALLSGVRNIIHTEHGRIFPDKRRYILMERILSRFVFKVVGVSDQTSQNMNKYVRIPFSKITTIVNGIDGSKYRPDIEKKAKKEELGLDPQAPVIGTIGRLVKEKGIEYLIMALKTIVADYPGIRLMIVGQGILQQSLRELVNQNGLKDNVFFTGSRLDTPQLYKVFDLFVLPSISEGLPMVLLEALASGCPIIATEVGGIPSLIQHGVNGSLVPPKDPDSLSKEILKLLGDAEKRSEYIENGLKIFNQSYDVRIMTKKYESLYNQSMMRYSSFEI
jgi:sugar transferase (PEP-CTERM/EpsH1 system associated)